MSRMVLLVLLPLSIGACDRRSTSPTPQAPTPVSDDAGGEDGVSAGDRSPVVPTDHPLYGRFEGEGFANDCTTDGDCHKGGCSGEVCSAEAEVMSTCELMPVRLPDDAQCGCLSNECRWTSASGAGLVDQPAQ